ncbi:hypothetical protein PF010_g6743 [Phytophthora fragariae]|uniref:Uncharacterized protein n=1 Tax=Phytophthora fragariae TaxID=53985 RepID=A0A6G0LK27_9STRA|nr:hypothetical protein PF010_g6743 [Phytophthora fragariae]
MSGPTSSRPVAVTRFRLGGSVEGDDGAPERLPAALADDRRGFGGLVFFFGIFGVDGELKNERSCRTSGALHPVQLMNGAE